MSSWILSSLVSECALFWTIVIVVVSWCLLLSHRVLFGLSCCVLGSGRVSWLLVVGCGYVVKLIGTSLCTVLSFPLPPSWLCCLDKVWGRRRLSWRFVRCLTVVAVTSNENGLLHSDNRCAGLVHTGSSVRRRRCVECGGWVVLS